VERAFLRFCATHRLPTPRTNVFIEDFEVDAHFPGTRLIVELDARSTHTTPRTFERDRERDRRLAVAGYLVVRVTELQMTTDPDALAADLVALVATAANEGWRPA
jgi:very-short-patch-repair endonuclease